MTQVRRQGDEVPGNCAAIGAALFQHPGCERMTKVMDAWLLTSLRRNTRSSQQGAERTIDGRRVELSVLDGWEEPIALARALAPDIKIALERFDDGGVQRHQAALAELCFPNVQNAIGQDVIEPECKSFGDAKSSGRDQTEEHDIEFDAADWAFGA